MRALFLFLLFFLSLAANTAPLRIGILPYDPPFEIEADRQNHFFGFDVDIMTEICNRLKADCHFIPLTFRDIFTQLVSHKIDLGIGAISITQTRQETFLFSLPYLQSSAQFVARRGERIRSIEDIREKRVGSVEGTLFKAVILEKFNHLVQIVEFRTLSECLEALYNDRIDVAITDKATAKYWVDSNSALFKLVGEGIPIGIGYGIMANKTEQELINNINKALNDMESDGTYLKIYKRYFSQTLM